MRSKTALIALATAGSVLVGASMAWADGNDIVPGNDKTHPRAVGEKAGKLIPGSEVCILLQTEHPDVDVSPAEELEEVADQHAKLYVDFMRKHGA